MLQRNPYLCLAVVAALMVCVLVTVICMTVISCCGAPVPESLSHVAVGACAALGTSMALAGAVKLPQAPLPGQEPLSLK